MSGPLQNTGIYRTQPQPGPAGNMTEIVSAGSNMQFCFGQGVAAVPALPVGASFLGQGNINTQVPAAAINPASTAADIVVAVYPLPANSLDGVGNRGLNLSAAGSFANNANAKRCKIIFNPTTAVVGSAVVGGTTLADTGASTAANVGWQLSAQVFKYGAANSNTQYGQGIGGSVGATNVGVGLPALMTATENAQILIAVTANATTAATDIGLNAFDVNAMN